MNKYLLYLFFLSISCNVFGGSNIQYSDSLELKHSIYFIGDMGEAPLVDSNIKMLKKQLDFSKENGTLVVLGNSISKEYLDKDREDDEFVSHDLNRFLTLAKDFSGEVVFIR